MNLCEKEKCSSCGACVSACPKNCIGLKEDEYGYIYPKIESDICVGCGKCNTVCHVINDVDFYYPKSAYAVWSLDENDRKTSTSGGAASVFYQKVISQNGVCYGAIVDEDLNVIIDGYSDENIIKFKNSKYVHSDMMDSYHKIKDDLSKNKKVIFIGLPCQVAAIKKFLGKDYENLFLVDIICHGTPPKKHLDDHISYIDKKSGMKTKSIKFRNDNEFMFMNYENNNSAPFYTKTKNADSYLLPFFEALNYYESCYSCKYAQNKRVSDITIGDFWGLGLEEPFNHPYSGAISLVLINTEKGNEFFKIVENRLFVEERSVKEALLGNDQLNKPSKLNENRDDFFRLYKENGFEYAVDKIYGEYMKQEEKIYNKYQRKMKLRRIAKKVLRR